MPKYEPPPTYRDFGFDQFVEKKLDFALEMAENPLIPQFDSYSSGQLAASLPGNSISNDKILNLEVQKLETGSISSKQITLAIEEGTGDVYFNAGKTDFTTTDSGFIVGLDDSDSNRAKVYLGSATQYWYFDGTNVSMSGTFTAGSLHIPDQNTTANSMHVDTNGDTWWGTTNTLWTADNNNATAYILSTGVARFASVTLTSNVAISGIANSTATDIALLEKSHNLTFSVTDADTIAWTSGTIVFSNGRTFTISSGNTGNMSALTYIYLDPAVSSTVLQTTTTYSTAMGANKSLLGMAKNNTITASFIPYGAGQPLIDGADIGALSIVAANIAASTITAAKMSVSQLSAIAADMGTITAGTVTGATIQTASSGTRFVMTSTSFQGINTAGTTIFEVIISGGDAGDAIIGDDAGTQFFKWDNSAGTCKLNNFDLARQEIFGKGTDGDVTISGNTTLSADMYYNNLTISSNAVLTTSGWRIFVLGTLTINSGCTIRWNGNAGSASPSNSEQGNGGAALTGNSLPGSASGSGVATGDGRGGSNSSAGNGANGSAGGSQTKGLGTAGVAGGNGGLAGGGASTVGSGGAGGSLSGTIYNPPTSSSTAAYLLMDSRPTPTAFAGSCGGGQGGGGAANTFPQAFASGTDNGGGGGGGGSGGGVIAIYAKNIINSGTIEALGGAGGNGGPGLPAGVGAAGGGGGGGGSGGSGGVLILVYNSKTGAGTESVAGGAAGSGGAGGSGAPAGSSGSNGSAGTTGNIYQLQIT